MKHKLIRTPIYGTRIMLLDTKEPVKKWGLEMNYTPFASTIWGSYKSRGVEWNCVYMVFNTAHENPSLNMGVIAHEGLHAAHMIFDSIGAEPSFDHDEPLAYLLTWIVNETVKFLD